MKPYSGYTLLETLLVIAILTIITITGLEFYLQRTDDIKVEKTVAQMQNLMLAAANYYIKNNCWPNSAACSQPAPDFNAYIPVGSTENPWLKPYIFQADTFGKKFQLQTTGMPQKLAERIAIKLPNAISTCTVEQCQVLAEEVIPAQQTALAENLVVKEIYTFSRLQDGSQTKVYPFTCPQGWTAKGEVMLSSLFPTVSNTMPFFGALCIGAIPYRVISKSGSDVNCLMVGNKYQCSFSISANARDNGFSCGSFDRVNYGLINVVFIGYCINNQQITPSFL